MDNAAAPIANVIAPNVFLSWSQSRGRRLAEAIYQFIPDVIQNARPWLSSEDIDKGRRWGLDVATALRDVKVGVICLTPESLNARWILFEAGALAKTLDTAYVCPYLLNLSFGDVPPPLSDFMMTTTGKEDTLKLVRTLNRALGEFVDPGRLVRSFEKFWPDLERTITTLAAEKVAEASAVQERKPEDVMEELLSRIKGIERRIERPETPRAHMTFSDAREADAAISSLKQARDRLDYLNRVIAAMRNDPAGGAVDLEEYGRLLREHDGERSEIKKRIRAIADRLRDIGFANGEAFDALIAGT